MSPAALITGVTPPEYKTKAKLNFGDYVEVLEPMIVLNSTDSRMVSLIALYPSEIAQGTWYFWYLETRQIVHRKQWAKLLTTQTIIQRVEQLGKDDGQKDIRGNFNCGTSMKCDTKNDKLQESNEVVEINDNETASNILEDEQQWEMVEYREVSGSTSIVYGTLVCFSETDLYDHYVTDADLSRYFSSLFPGNRQFSLVY